MKLIDKISLWFLAFTAVVLIGGGMLVFFTVQKEIDEEAIRRLHEQVQYAAEELKRGTPAEDLATNQLSIRELANDIPERPLHVQDTMAVFDPRKALDRKLTVSQSFRVNGKHYYISLYSFVAEPDEIADAVIESLQWIFVILFLIVGIGNRLISKSILTPFYRTIEVIKQFSLKHQRSSSLPVSTTKEFKELNIFLNSMMQKAQSDYRALKEFTENASHELQTPLAIIRGKLELLLESDLSSEQAGYIQSALASIEKLSKINRSLSLLNRLENEEFVAIDSIDFSTKLNVIIEEMMELLEMKSLSIRKEIESDVHLAIHPTLADVLLTNLLNNAVRHNFENGKIEVKLSSNELIIRNTGEPPQVDTKKLFERFKKSNQQSDSIGLGLAIVKQICDLSRLKISYDYGNGFHEITIRWSV